MAHLERDVAEVEQRRQRDKQRAPLGRVDAEHVPRVTGRREAFRLSFLPAAPRDDIIGRRGRAGRAVEQNNESNKKARGHVHRARGLVERRRVVDAVAPRKAAAARQERAAGRAWR